MYAHPLFPGSPPPRLVWYKKGRILDSSFTITHDGTVRNDLELPRLTRDDLLVSLTCSAANTNLTNSREVTVLVDMTLAPLETRILNVPLTVSEHAEYQATCQSQGSRPPAKITWMLNDRVVDSGVEATVSGDVVRRYCWCK